MSERLNSKFDQHLLIHFRSTNFSSKFDKDSRSSSLGVNGHAGSVQAEFQQKLSHYDSTLLYSTQLETEKEDKQ